jgi:hypothetical protein
MAIVKGIEGKLTITRRHGSGDETFMYIELEDDNAVISPIEIKISPENLMLALTAFACQECTFSVSNLDKVGKVREHKDLKFPVVGSDKKNAIEECKKHTPEGWIARESYNSQDSFTYVDGVNYIAKTQLVRWVDRE